MGGELDGKQGTPQEQAGSLDTQGQAPAQQQDGAQAQDADSTNATSQGAPDTQASAVRGRDGRVGGGRVRAQLLG